MKLLTPVCLTAAAAVSASSIRNKRNTNLCDDFDTDITDAKAALDDKGTINDSTGECTLASDNQSGTECDDFDDAYTAAVNTATGSNDDTTWYTITGTVCKQEVAACAAKLDSYTDYKAGLGQSDSDLDCSNGLCVFTGNDDTTKDTVAEAATVQKVVNFGLTTSGLAELDTDNMCSYTEFDVKTIKAKTICTAVNSLNDATQTWAMEVNADSKEKVEFVKGVCQLKDGVTDSTAEDYCTSYNSNYASAVASYEALDLTNGEITFKNGVCNSSSSLTVGLSLMAVVAAYFM